MNGRIEIAPYTTVELQGRNLVITQSQRIFDAAQIVTIERADVDALMRALARLAWHGPVVLADHGI